MVVAPPRLDDRLRDFAAAVEAPDFIIPWLDRFYEPEEIGLVLEAAAGGLPGECSRKVLERAFRRAVLDREGEAFRPADFHSRYELWALYEHWADVPQEIRDLLNEWELNDYLAEVGAGIQAVLDNRLEDSDQQDYTFLLLEEAEALLRTRRAIYLWPCNCRAMMGKCDKSHTVCLRFDNDRDVGWEISPERAIQILRQSAREGLMHTAYLSSTHGHHGICNCCSCCCFPILAGEKLGAADVWPVRRYLAVVDTEACTLCGRCVKRCPFDAITIDRRREPKLQIDVSVCRGCGVCATGCGEGAMDMQGKVSLPADAGAGFISDPS
jgi:Pyruvate/2-oxoacid:ferredoxin oxidoreductase delta subunit